MAYRLNSLGVSAGDVWAVGLVGVHHGSDPRGAVR